jgi:hypothetical protein
MSEIISQEVFLMERLKSQVGTDGKDNKEDAAVQQHLKAIVFIRPTVQSIELLVAALRRPRYKEFHICNDLSFNRIYV